ncbi:MAG: mandelate racemase/muconate lactonizing enzyme family protein [Oscillospiraceae bacterium]|nr:mandelate racemase/muconate lactonizing enzyme family protein [Oscillospiraceae bacterium]
MIVHKISDVQVHLAVHPVADGVADATRRVETIGFLVVRLTTDQGLEGIGVTYHEVGGEAVSDLITRNMAPGLIGRSPFETEKIWCEMCAYLRGVGRKGLMFCALSAIDNALWDLKGKILGLPLYRLLGGAERMVPVYASGGWTSYDDGKLLEEVSSMLSKGYTHIKIKVGVDGGKNPQRDLQRVRKVREMIGDQIVLMLDANNCWDAATAVKFADAVKECDILFLEEPVFADDIPGLRRYRRSSCIPLATGEHEYTKYGARDLVLAEAADIIQMDAARVGGYTEMLKIAAITQAWNLRFAPHAMEHLHMHLVSAYSHMPFLERLMLYEEVTGKLYKNAPVPVNGYLEIPEKPGFGLELDMDFIRRQD